MKRSTMLAALAATVGMAWASTATAHGGSFPRVMFYPYYYPPYAYSAHGPFYSHVYPYHATYYYPHYAPYYPMYPTAYVGGPLGYEQFWATAQYPALPTPMQAGPYGTGFGEATIVNGPTTIAPTTTTGAPPTIGAEGATPLANPPAAAPQNTTAPSHIPPAPPTPTK